jgi:hypothetical protein
VGNDPFDVLLEIEVNRRLHAAAGGRGVAE